MNGVSGAVAVAVLEDADSRDLGGIASVEVDPIADALVFGWDRSVSVRNVGEVSTFIE
jgi:hypothetical protein